MITILFECKVNKHRLDFIFCSFFLHLWIHLILFFIIIYSFISGFSVHYDCLLPLDPLQDFNSIQIQLSFSFLLVDPIHDVCVQIIDFFSGPEIVPQFTYLANIRCKKTKLVTTAWENYNVAKHERITHSQTDMQGNGGCMFNHHFSSLVWISMFYMHVRCSIFFFLLTYYLYSHNTEHS